MSTNATDETHGDSAPSTLERLTALLLQLDSSWRAWESEQAEYGKLQRRAEAMTRSRDIVLQNLTTTETARASAGVQLHNLEVEAETVEEKWRELSEHQQNQSQRQEGLIERTRVTFASKSTNEAALVSADLEWRSCTDDLNIAEAKVSALEQRAEELSIRIGLDFESVFSEDAAQPSAEVLAPDSPNYVSVMGLRADLSAARRYVADRQERTGSFAVARKKYSELRSMLESDQQRVQADMIDCRQQLAAVALQLIDVQKHTERIERDRIRLARQLEESAKDRVGLLSRLAELDNGISEQSASSAPLAAAKARAESARTLRSQLQHDVQVFCGTLSVTTAARVLKRMRKRADSTKLSAAVEEWFLLQAAELGVPASVEQHSVVSSDDESESGRRSRGSQKQKAAGGFGFSFFTMIFGSSNEDAASDASKPAAEALKPLKPAPPLADSAAASKDSVVAPVHQHHHHHAPAPPPIEVAESTSSTAECVVGGPSCTGLLTVTRHRIVFDRSAPALPTPSPSLPSPSAAQGAAVLTRRKTISAEYLSIEMEDVQAVSLLQPQSSQTAGAEDESIILQLTLSQRFAPRAPAAKLAPAMTSLSAISRASITAARAAKDQLWSSPLRFLGPRSTLMPLHHAFLHWMMTASGHPRQEPLSSDSESDGEAEAEPKEVQAIESPAEEPARVIDARLAWIDEIDVVGDSDFFDDTYRIKEIVSAGASRYRLKSWHLLYSLQRHGVSLKTMYSRLDEVRGTIILIRDQGGKVFGAFCSEPWRVRGGYYGNGEGFVFEFAPALKRYAWTGDNSFFMMSSMDALAVGGGTNFAMFVDKQILNGTSGPCSTFNSPRLSSTDQFQVGLFEIWGTS